MNDTKELLLFLATPFLLVVALYAAITAADYYISSQATVDRINQQCGTSYQRIDYLRVGADTMRDLCRTRQQRITLEQP